MASTRFAHRADDLDPQTNWMVLLRPHEVQSIAAATGVDPMRIQRMTLAEYDGTALFVDPCTHQVNRKRLWGRNAGSRYCPHCLTETEGRWRLSWRLGWSFFCPLHLCLLADTCPRCVRMQRIYRFRSSRILHPALCAYPALHHTRRTRCDTDLRHATSDAFPDDSFLAGFRRGWLFSSGILEELRCADLDGAPLTGTLTHQRRVPASGHTYRVGAPQGVGKHFRRRCNISLGPGRNHR
ncbi:TniQ family protein [Nonomuraea sp. NPDC049695]|uniref:TniQ family protein n=1 Tax=Nonomuraea sp. NPDC049695 TaxID=3154734 RepID=UPI0034431210